MRTPTLML